MVARYRVRSPAEWAFYGPKAEDVLRAETTAAMVRSIGEMGVDRVLSDGRKTLIATATPPRAGGSGCFSLGSRAIRRSNSPFSLRRRLGERLR